MKMRLLAPVLAVLALQHGVDAALAGPAGITFEEFARPGSASHVTDQYAHLGVRFSTVQGFDIRGVERRSVDVIAYPFGAFGNRAAAMWGNPVTLTFDHAITELSVLMADTETGTFLGSVEAFDGQGRSVAFSQAYTGAYNTPWFFQQTLSVRGQHIRSVVLRSDTDGAVFDNLTFTAAVVPMPASAGVLALCIAMGGRRRR